MPALAATLLLGAGHAQAQEGFRAPPAVHPDSREELEPPEARAVAPKSAWPQAHDAERPPLARAESVPPTSYDDAAGDFALELVGGTLGAALSAGLAVGWAFLGVRLENCAGRGDFCGVTGLVIGGGIGLLHVPAMTVLGVHLAGDQTGGSGKWGWTMLGVLSGLSATAAIAIIAEPDADWQALAIPIAGALAGAIGGTLAYRLSSDDPLEQVQLRPSLFPGQLGLAATAHF